MKLHLIFSIIKIFSKNSSCRSGSVLMLEYWPTYDYAHRFEHYIALIITIMLFLLTVQAGGALSLCVSARCDDTLAGLALLTALAAGCILAWQTVLLIGQSTNLPITREFSQSGINKAPPSQLSKNVIQEHARKRKYNWINCGSFYEGRWARIAFI